MTTTEAGLVDVRVRALSSTGAGVADLPEGQVVFVPRTAPGDHVRIQIEKMKKRWATGSVVEILEQSEDRTKPPCKLYDRCGGCSVQHLPYASQLEWKGRLIADAFERIAHVPIEPPVVAASPVETAYRNRITYTLRRLRGGRVVAGFHALGRPTHVIEVTDECLLPEPGLTEAWQQLRSSWGLGARWLPDAGRLRLTLRTSGDRVVLLVEGGPEGWQANKLAASTPRLAAIWHRPSGGAAAVRVSGEEVTESWGEEVVPVGAGAFLQVNREVAATIQSVVLEEVGKAERVVDAYCGVGAYARPIARRGAHVVAIESDEEAVIAARFEAPATLEVRQGTVEEHLAQSLPADVVIVNPPRTGLDESVPATILASPPARIVYVSCDPATLARDVERLSEGYTVESIRAFDLFPQTAHVETVAILEARTEAS